MDQREDELTFVKRCLVETRGKWPEAASGSGVPISTVRKIAQGRIADPAYSKVSALAMYFRTTFAE